MRPTPRKNFRGFSRHAQALVDRLVREEFPELGYVWACPFVFHKAKDGARAHWHEEALDDDLVYRAIMLNTNTTWGRTFYLEVDDAELLSILRHELLHGEMKRRGQPFFDDDAPFIMECLRRRIIVNDSSIDAFEAIYGHRSFGIFRWLLPPAVEAIPLAEGAGVWLREQGR